MNMLNKRWFAIKGETVGEGKYAMSVVRVQTSKDGAWQALTNQEIDLLIIEHNKAVNIPRFDLKAQVKKLGADSLLPKKGKKK